LNPLSFLSGGGLPNITGGPAHSAAGGGAADQFFQLNSPFNVAGQGGSASSSGGQTARPGGGTDNSLLLLAGFGLVALLVTLK